ncbi:MAG: carboxypeptidase-like regulatory domain-containing protein, partial [Bacteroidales bacterium]|nr:carboxypeptidase-like regulatory domain-containing protein [Bacteroidales bacterium]
VFRIVFFVFLIVLKPFQSEAQVTRIMGVVLDNATQKPVPFANVFFQNTTRGVSADFDGAFSIDIQTTSDTLIASALGYKKRSIAIKRGVFQEVIFRLEPVSFSLGEVEVFAEIDPAVIIFNKTIEHKAENNPKEFDFLDYRLYNKIEVDANNVNEQFQKNRLLNKFQFVFQYMDTSTINGKAYLPVFISESVSRVYKKSNPKGNREIIQATQISGVENQSLSQYMGGLYQEVNVYDNYIQVFEKNFVSPISDNGRNTYDYVLIDTVELNNKQNFHLMFKPKRKQELTFVGELWIHDSTFAVTRVDMKAAVDANINFVNAIALSLEYDFVNKQNWVLSKDKITLDLNVVENSKKVPGFFATRSSYYTDFHFDVAPADSIFLNPVSVLLSKSAAQKTKEYWNENRNIPLSRNEKGIYQMVDSIQNIPLFKNYIDAVYMLTSGYLIWNKLELGPTFKTISSNTTEGMRFRFGGRTSNSFSKRLMLEGFLAYGLDDQQLKGGAGFVYMFNKNPYRKFSANYTYDLEQLGQTNVILSNDNFLTSILRRSPNDKQSLVEEFKIKYQHEWFSGVSATFSFNNRKMFPVGGLSFEVWDGATFQTLKSIKTTELGFSFRLAIQEKYLMGEFERINLGTKYPVLQLDAFYGLPHFFERNQEYFRLNLQLKHWFNVYSIGWSKYTIEAGKVWGTVPYPLLPIAPGNQTLIFDAYVFNLMNYYEFINDEYISAFYTHHFDGLFFNHIPLLRKLNWREVITAKGIMGNLSEKNANYSVFPPYSKSLTKPYYEVGVGIENIFKIVRVDFVWRLNHLEDPNAQRFGVLGSLQFNF